MGASARVTARLEGVVRAWGAVGASRRTLGAWGEGSEGSEGVRFQGGVVSCLSRWDLVGHVHDGWCWVNGMLVCGTQVVSLGIH